MNIYQCPIAKQLQAAFIRSQLSPTAFLIHIQATRPVIASRPETLSFKITIYEADGFHGTNEWFGYLNGCWQTL
jgi:hypothetical protein